MLSQEEANRVTEILADFQPLLDKLVVDHLNKIVTIEPKVQLAQAMQDTLKYIGYRIRFKESGEAEVK